jgi:adhesin transport system outer membrane protein
MADAALEEAGLDLTLRVIATFTESQRQQARLTHTQAGVVAHEQLLAMIRRRVAQEVSSQTDERLAQSRLFQAVNERSLAQQALTNALASLAQLVGQDAHGVVEVTAPGGYTLTDQLTTVAQAVTVSPVLHRLMAEEQAAQADVSAKQSLTKPQLAMRLERDLGQTYDQRVMLVLLAQPGAGLSAFSGIEAALARAEAVRQAKESARRDVQERVLLDWSEWTHAQQRLDNAHHFQAINTEVFESYKRQYVAGRKTWVDVLNAVREATQAQLVLEDARAQANAAAWRLAALTGQIYTAESDPK